MQQPMPIANRRKLLQLAGAGGAASLLAACGTTSVQSYKDEKPALDLAEYFNGPLTAQGLFVDRFGTVRRRFVVKMVGQWRAGEGVLTEDFVYDDGEKQQRIWKIRTLSAGRWVGTAADVIGDAQGEGSGSAVLWRYTLSLPVQGKVWEVSVDDWMHRIDEKHVLNRARFSKWGFEIGEVQIAFQKP